jgi:hypothetical protein
MPVSYQIHKQIRLVVIKFVGEVTVKDILDDRMRISRDADFDPSFNQLLDFRGATSITLSYSTIWGLARNTVFKPGIKKAIIAPNDVSYGFARMYEGFSSGLHQQIYVFRRADEAFKWLDIADDDIESFLSNND